MHEIPKSTYFKHYASNLNELKVTLESRTMKIRSSALLLIDGELLFTLIREFKCKKCTGSI